MKIPQTTIYNSILSSITGLRINYFHPPRRKKLYCEVHRPIGPSAQQSFPKTFAFHLRHRSRLEGLVYCTAYRQIGLTDQSQVATGRPLRTYLVENQTCQSEPTRLTRVGSPRARLKMSKPNPTHFLVSQKFCNPSQPTTGWWVKWVSSPTHLKNLFIYLIFKYLNKFLSNP